MTFWENVQWLILPCQESSQDVPFYNIIESSWFIDNPNRSRLIQKRRIVICMQKITHCDINDRREDELHSTSRHRKITIILQLSSHKQTDKAIEETLFLECIAVICINFTFMPANNHTTEIQIWCLS